MYAAALCAHSEELSVAKMNYNSYIHQANDYRQQIQDNEQEIKVLMVRSENARAAEAIQDVKVSQCVCPCVRRSVSRCGGCVFVAFLTGCPPRWLQVKELQKKLKEAEYDQKKLEAELAELKDTKEWKVCSRSWLSQPFLSNMRTRYCCYGDVCRKLLLCVVTCAENCCCCGDVCRKTVTTSW